MYITNNLLEALLNMNGQYLNKALQETNETFDYEIALPGLTREDLDIKAILEKDFLTILVEIKKESIFVFDKTIRIVKRIEEVLTEKDNMKVLMENGVLTVSLQKRNPITELKL